MCRIDSTPGRAAHVCSFSPALSSESSDLSELTLRRSSSPTNFRCSLLKADKLSPPWKFVHSADEQNASSKMQEMDVMFTRRLPNFGLREVIFRPSSRLHTIPVSPNASSITAHPSWKKIGQRQNNLRSDWTPGFLHYRGVRCFLV